MLKYIKENPQLSVIIAIGCASLGLIILGKVNLITIGHSGWWQLALLPGLLTLMVIAYCAQFVMVGIAIATLMGIDWLWKYCCRAIVRYGNHP